MSEIKGVYSAINAVQKDLARTGITKSRRNTQQGYQFRGIDDVFNTLSPLLAEHGLCILPRIMSRECQERTTAKGGTIFYVVVEAEFDFVASSDGSSHVVRTYGEAMDSADKATNKAMSAAYKYAALQAFSIPTEADNDADLHTHQVVPERKIDTSRILEAFHPHGITQSDLESHIGRAADEWTAEDAKTLRAYLRAQKQEKTS
jgi:hypothetical protein